MVEVSSVQASAVGRQDLDSLVDKTLILSNKYCCRSSDSPGGGMMGGRSVVVGFQLLSCMRFISLSGLVTESFTITRPGLVSTWFGVSESQMMHGLYPFEG